MKIEFDKSTPHLLPPACAAAAFDGGGPAIAVSKRRLELFRKELFAFMEKSGGMA